MRSQYRFAVVSLCSTAMAFASIANAGPDRPVTVRPNVVYGNDDRVDVKDSPNAMYRKMAESTVALFKNYKITLDRNTGIASLALGSYSRSMNLCSTERFFDQMNGAFCSGTLIAPDMILTAGHCITSESDCAQTSFVFGFAQTAANESPARVDAKQVYSCKSIVAHELVNTGADYAVVKIDRPVTDRAPMKVNRNGGLTTTTELVMIGHPSGLPTKIAAGAHSRGPENNGFFVATTDSYGGNSGSGVFNVNTGLLEGVLVRGEVDFERTAQGCIVSKVCAETACRGEDVTSASAFARFVP